MAEQSSAPPVELTRRIFERTNEATSEADAVDAWTSPLAVDVRWESVGLGTTFEGVEAVRGFLDVWAGRYEAYEVEPLEISDLGNGVVFVVSAHTGLPRGASGDVRLPREIMTHSFVWVHGTVTHVVSSGDNPEARAIAERLAGAGG